jgi:hypothetical protein
MAQRKARSRKGSFRKGPAGPHTGARRELKRATYYLTEDLIMRLKIRAARESKDQSTLIREILDQALVRVA